MADNKEITKVSLAMLEYYDSKIKEWHNKNSNSKRYIVFADRNNFPTTGDSEVLYIDGSKMYYWDTTSSQYELIKGTGEENTGLTWQPL